MSDEEELSRLPSDRSVKSMAYKTVDVFAGITGRKLWLKNADDGQAKTNGFLIEVPFDDPHAYQLTEHEISHVLFESDVLAKAYFVEEYAKKVSEVASKRGVDLSARNIRIAIDTIANVLDDERVISLWGLLYRGSEKIMRRMKYEDAQPYVDQAHDNLLTLLCCLAGRVEVPEGKLDRFRPYMLEALRKVYHRDHHAVLVASKWLIAMMVGEIIRENRGEDPLSIPDQLLMPGAKTGPGQGPESSEGAGEPQAGQGPGEAPSAAHSEAQEAEDTVPRMPYEAAEDEDEEEPSRAGGGAGASAQAGEEEPSEQGGPWQPPEVEANVDERSRALAQLAEQLGRAPRELADKLSDVHESKYKRAGQEQRARRNARKALNQEVKEANPLEHALDASAAQMRNIVQKVRHQVRNAWQEDDWIRRDAMAKVVFHDVKKSDTSANIHLDPDDDAVVRRLRAAFFRILGRRAMRQEEAGVEIDVPSYIERRLNYNPLPVFRTEARGRGFKALVLIDRSSSMKGYKTVQAERGCRIISRALRFPFVESEVWGFQSWERGQVDITRFEQGMEVFETSQSHVGGMTPLHTAIRVAVRHLEEGSEKKQLFVISDGWPTFARKSGTPMGTRALMSFVRKDVDRARSKGIGVTAVMIGVQTGRHGVQTEVKPHNMNRMFGSHRHWRLMGQDFGGDLVRLVARSFADYLQRG